MWPRYVLVKPFEIVGPDFLGRSASIALEPAKKPGWYVRVKGQDVLIRPQNLFYQLRRVVLRAPEVDGNFALQVVEHLFALRWFFDEVRLVPGSSWIPYGDSSASIFWHEFTKSGRCRPDGYMRLSKIDGVHSVYGRHGDSHRSQVTMGPSSGVVGALQIDTRIEFQNFCRGHLRVGLPTDEGDAVELLSARAPGWPRWLYGVATIASRLGWPHKDSISWPNGGSAEEVAVEWCRHRIIDILGAFGTMIEEDRVPAMRIDSYRAGHQLDIELLRLYEQHR